MVQEDDFPMSSFALTCWPGSDHALSDHDLLGAGGRGFESLFPTKKDQLSGSGQGSKVRMSPDSVLVVTGMVTDWTELTVGHRPDQDQQETGTCSMSA